MKKPNPSFKPKRRNRLVQSYFASEIKFPRFQIFGNVPRPLFRAFEEKEFAQSFCDGYVRFKLLEYYNNTEDSRADGTEGAGEMQAPGEELIWNEATQTLTSVPGLEHVIADTHRGTRYICCFSKAHNGGYEHLPDYFGQWYVKIHTPLTLLRRVAKAMRELPELSKNLLDLQASHVRYDKGLLTAEKYKPSQVDRLRWMQKPPRFSVEWEYRLHFKLNFPDKLSEDGTFTLYVGDLSDICEVFRR